MPIAKQAFVRATVIAILIGALALLGIVGVTLWLVSETQGYTAGVNSARDIRSSTVNLFSLLQDAETGQRGYLLTLQADYLKPYDEARARIGVQAGAMHAAADSDPALKPLAAQLDRLIADKLAELQETIDLTRAGNREAAQATVSSNRGKALMDQTRGIIDQIVSEAEHRIDDSLAGQATAIGALRAVTLAGAIVIVVVLGTYTLIVFRYTRELIAAEKKVQVLNAGLEERINERTADLSRANEEIQRFAYIVTHDLRAPLVNIMGFTSELDASLAAVKGYIEQPDPAQREAALPAARAAASEDLPEAIKFIRSSTRKMDGLINAILNLSREGRRTLKPVAIDVRAALDAAAGSVRHQVMEAGGEIVIEGTAPALVSDRMALDQIFGNLLDNAVKYRDRERPIHIHLRMREGAGNRVVVEVEDNGRGILSQDHERIFDLFRRSGAQDQPGEGIGLAHVRAMARNLGGNITLTSQLGRGSIFTLTVARDLRRIIPGGTT
jgi:signal transduction histidine kinase